MTKRSPVLSLDDVMMLEGAVSPKPAPAPDPSAVPVELAPAPLEASPEASSAADDAPHKGGRKPVPDVFRTSLYFHRSVHDALREIAYDERLTISDLINEGIDQVLKGRGYPPAAQLKAKGAPKRKR